MGFMTKRTPVLWAFGLTILGMILGGCGSSTYLVPPTGGLSRVSLGYQQAVEERQAAVTQNIDQAIHDEETVLAQNPRYVPGLRRLAQLFLEAGNPTAARQELRQACQVEPKNAENWLLLAQFDQNLGRLEAADQEYHRALAVNPGEWQAWDGLAFVAVTQKRWAVAWQQAETAQLVGGNQAPTFDAFGRVLAGEGDWADAMQYFVDAQATDPGWWQPYYDLARGDLVFGDVSEAQNNLEQALTEDPANAASWQLLHHIQATTGP